MKMQKFGDFCAYAVPRCFRFPKGPVKMGAIIITKAPLTHNPTTQRLSLIITAP
ncbi:Uncharacterised protein [Escherichia coli]|nr:Uncharacterised protein [Escherichia coli]